MIKFHASFQIPRVDIAAYQKELRKQLIEALTIGAFEWLNAALAEIPAWSGASRATFLHLSREIGYSLNITPKTFAPRDGISRGMSASDGQFNLDEADKGRVSFSYETTLRHLIYNEYNNANLVPDPGLFSHLVRPGPYNFQVKAAFAYLRAVGSAGLPNPRRYIKVTTKLRVK
jgi:hypothetical protein